MAESPNELLTSLPLHRRLLEQGFVFFLMLCVLLALLPLGSVLYWVVVQGWPALTWETVTSLPTPTGITGGGFAQALQGTLVMVSLAVLVCAPLGFLVGIFLAQPDSLMRQVTRFIVNVLAGIPSILIGVFAYAVVVVSQKSFSALAGSMALGIVMLPVLIRATEEACRLVAEEWQVAAYSLGASQTQVTLGIVLPNAAPGMVTGGLLAIARAAGETAPLLFTALFSQYYLTELNRPTASLSVLIFNYATTYAKDLQAKAWAAALVLVGLALMLNIFARWVTRPKL